MFIQDIQDTVFIPLVHGSNKNLICVDYLAIEGRVVAWLAGQEDKLEVYRTHGKVYEATAAKLPYIQGFPDLP